MTTSRRRYLALSPSVIPPVYRDPTQQYTEQVLAVYMIHTAQCPLTVRGSAGEAPFQSGLRLEVHRPLDEPSKGLEPGIKSFYRQRQHI